MHHYCGWEPGHKTVDALKGEGRWNNDWDASLELLRRHSLVDPPTPSSSNSAVMPSRADLIDVFSRFYFGSDPEGDPFAWDGFICDEPLLVDPNFFTALSNRDILWGFVSGAEPPSARFLLEQRLGLQNPPLIAMGDAPDKPDPTGLVRLAKQLAAGDAPQRIIYIGDTVADVTTVINARTVRPDLPWQSLAVSPPHVENVRAYQQTLRAAGADRVLESTLDLLNLP